MCVQAVQNAGMILSGSGVAGAQSVVEDSSILGVSTVGGIVYEVVHS